MIRIALVGAGGRMGLEIISQLAGTSDMVLVAAVEAPGHRAVGSRIGDVVVRGSIADATGGADVVVDFSTAKNAARSAGIAAGAAKPFVTGVTGLDESQMRALREAAEKIPVVHAPNFSVGVNVLARLAVEAARSMGADYDIEVVETHHRMKKDAPSGTARMLVERLAAATGRDRVVTGRDGDVGAKPVGQIGVSSIRTGSVVGEHTVVFGGPGERLELTHKAESRAAFASGVLTAVRFARNRPPGLYSMADVLNTQA